MRRMKKSYLVLLIVFGMFMSATVVSAATGTSIKATLTKLQIYFGNSKISGSVINYKNNNYVPAKILSDELGYDINANSTKFTITEDESKDDLRNEIKGLEKQIKDLNKQLDLYRGYIPDDSAYKTITEFNIVDGGKNVYKLFWNKVTPFKVNGEIYDKYTYGILFDDYNKESFYYQYIDYPAFEFMNPELKYSKLKFSCAIDDLGIALQNDAKTGVIIKGFSETLGKNILLDEIISRDLDIVTFEVDIKGYDRIAIMFKPDVKDYSGYLAISDREGYDYSFSYGNYYGSWERIKDYVLLINPEVK